jgi:LmbE family N-acetylglucosaminyl deacetylase
MLIPERAPRVLAIGAHPDDIELGAGGFVHRLMHKCQATVHFLILTEGLQGLAQSGSAASTLRRKEAHDAAELLGVSQECVELLSYPDCQLHEKGHEIIREIEKRLYGDGGAPRYDAVLTHSGEDTHADHRAAHESTLSAVRYFYGAVLLYQAPSVKPNSFHPTFFVKLDEKDVKQKDLAVMAHVSQRDRDYTRASRTLGMTDNWAIFLRLPNGTYLEAFEVYKSFFG